MSDMKTEFKVKGEELIEFIKKAIHEGNIRRIIIKDDKGNTYMEVPVTFGVIGFFIAPILIAVGALAAMTGVFNVEIVKRKATPAKKHR
jgi:hypothetical protein